MGSMYLLYKMYDSFAPRQPDTLGTHTPLETQCISSVVRPLGNQVPAVHVHFTALPALFKRSHTAFSSSGPAHVGAENIKVDLI